MSFLHTHSQECMKSELNLFSMPPTQTSIDTSHWVMYKPVSSLTTDGPVEYVVPGSSDEYIDLPHTLLYVKVTFQPPDQNVNDANTDALLAQIGPTNNLLHSLFDQVSVTLNHQLVSPASNNYAYQSYIESLLSYGSGAKHSHLSTVLWHDDTPGKMDSFTENTGLAKRRSQLNTGKSVDLIGHIHSEMFNQDRLLINGVEVGIKFVRSKDGFAIMDPTNSYKVVINDSALYVRRVKVYPNILLEHSKLLSTMPAKYPVTRVQVKSVVLHSGILGETIDNIFMGTVPRRIICGFVKNQAYNGHRLSNPFNFEHFNINYFSLSIDGLSVPARQLQPNFEDNLFVESYHSLFTGTGVFFLNQGNCITRESFKGGYCLFAFDLTPDLSSNSNDHFNLVKHGSIRIDVRFKKALADNINCIIYAEFNSIVEIDSTRQIITDFVN